MVAREVRHGLVTYRDADGKTTHGLLGETVDVHEDDLERFDRLNGTPEGEQAKPAAKKTAGNRK